MKRPLSLAGTSAARRGALDGRLVLACGIVTWHVTLGNAQPPALFTRSTAMPRSWRSRASRCWLPACVQVRRGWSPINQLRTRLARIREARERRLEGDYPSEVAAAGRRSERAARAARANGQPRARQGRRSRARIEDAAGGAGAGGRARRRGGPRRARRHDPRAGRRACGGRWTITWRRRASASPTRPGAAARTSVRESADGLARTLARLHAERGIDDRRRRRPAARRLRRRARISTRCWATCSTTRASGRGGAVARRGGPPTAIASSITSTTTAPGSRRRCATRSCSAACGPTKRARLRPRPGDRARPRPRARRRHHARRVADGRLARDD